MDSPLILFAKQHNVDISAFEMCSIQTDSIIKRIKSLYDVPPFSPDEDMVVYGSIARRECVEGSDIDWTLLIDGQANALHSKMVSGARKRLQENGFKDPGTSGLFGQISFSHELIHHIGGQSDSNHNLTKRILLLLESSRISFGPIISDRGTPYDRIIKGIIWQYVEHDSGLNSGRLAIPRFLLNDMVRYWRTMCVDFAYKQKEQDGDKWALRNIKLRMSRKLLFAKGLLMCFSNYEEWHDKPTLIDNLCNLVRLTPLETIIYFKDHFKLDVEDIKQVISSYNEFLLKLNDSDIRKELEKMNMDDVNKNEVFNNLRKIAKSLQEALLKLFIRNGGLLSELTIKYGIF